MRAVETTTLGWFPAAKSWSHGHGAPMVLRRPYRLGMPACASPADLRAMLERPSTFQLTCGADGAMPCDAGIPESGLGRLGGLGGNFGSLGRIFCSELDLVLDTLKSAVFEVNRLYGTVQVLPQVLAANDFVRRFDSFTGGPPILSSETCKNTVEAAEIHIRSINELISAKGGTQVRPPESDVSSEGPLTKFLNSVRGVLIPAAVIVAVVVAAPVVLPPLKKLLKGG